MNENLHQVEASIERMTAVVRQAQGREVARSFGDDVPEGVRPLGWWVLACGEELGGAYADVDETVRAEARERLLESVRRAGLMLPENVWVWDDTGRVQLVVSSVPTLKRAKRLADHLRQKGLSIRVRREKI